jgi:hypothetical protein
LAASAWGDSDSGWTQNVTSRQKFRTAPIGLGVLAGTTAGALDRAFLVEGHNHLKQRAGFYGMRQYGQGQGRLELGTGIGMTLASTTGVTLLGLDGGTESGLMPHFGVEPFSGQMSFNTNDSREDYYQWMPMAAAGAQLGAGPCRLMANARGGAGAGNLGKEGFAPALRPAFGASTYLNCSQLDVALEVTRMRDRGGGFIDLALVDVAYALDRRDDWKLGIRGESTMVRGAGSAFGATSLEAAPGDRSEQRAMLVLRGRAFSLN